MPRTGKAEAVAVSAPAAEPASALKGAGQRDRAIVDTMGEGAVTLAADGVILYASRRFAEMVGCDLAKVIGATLDRFVARGDAGKVQHLLNQAAGGFAKSRVLLQRPDSTVFPCRLTMRALDVEAKTIVAVATDLSDLEMVEAERERLARLVETTEDAVLGNDLDGNVTDWNRGAERLYGYAASEMIGRNVAILVPREHQEEVASLVEKLVRGETVERLDTERITKAGKRIQVSLSLSAIKDASGKIVGVSTAVRDITGRTRVESDAREAARYARSLLEASLDPLVTISPDGKITDVNRATEEATGYGREQIIGRDFADFFVEPDSARAGYRLALARGQVVDYPLALQHRSGAVMDVLYNASVYRDQSGAVAGVFAAARNVTARRRAEESRFRAVRALRMINACNNVVIRAVSEDGLLADVCRTMVEVGGYRLAWVGYAQQDVGKSVRPVAIGGDDEDYVRQADISWADVERGQGPTGTAIRTGRVVVARDIPSDPSFGPWRQYATRKGYRSSATLPLGADGKTYGALMVYSGDSDAFDADEVRLLTELAEDLAYGTAAIRAKAAEQRAKQEALRASLYARGLIEAGLDPMIAIGRDGRILDVNKAAEEATGRSRAQLIGTDASSVFTEPERARAAYLDAFAKGFVTDHALAMLSSTGKVMEVLFNAAIYRDENGDVAGVLAAARDVTALRENERRFRTLFEQAAVGNSITAMTGEITANAAFCRMLGYADEELKGRRWQDITHPDDIEVTRKEIDALVSGTRDSIRFIKRYLHKNGSVVWADESSRIGGRDVDGRPTYLVTSVVDISGRKRVDEELARHREHLEELVKVRTAELTKANQDLQAANVELEAFSYSVSHDLRPPLRAIDGFSRILVEDYGDKLDDEGKRIIGVVHDGTVKMSRLIDDILAFSHASRQQMTPVAVDMETSARSALDELRPVTAGRNLKIDIKPLPQARGDAAMLQRVWTGLLDNSIKFTAPKPEAVIEIGGKVEAGEAIYWVKDNGIGFDMQYAGKLFGVFQRLHGPDEYPGTGIGLAIVKQIVTRHGGRVWAEGRPGEGASFYFALPSREAEDA